MPQNTESFPGKGMYRTGQCECVCACVWMEFKMELRRRSVMNSIRLIIFAGRV